MRLLSTSEHRLNPNLNNSIRPVGSLWERVTRRFPEYFNRERIEAYESTTVDEMYGLHIIAAFFAGTCTSEEARSARDIITRVETSLNPNWVASDMNNIRRRAEEINF